VDENEIGKRVLGCAVAVHRTLGPGLLESVYETCLAHELGKAGLTFERQRMLPVTYDGLTMESGYRIDVLVLERVVIEVKAIEKVLDVHRAQLLSYLRLGGYRLGYLLNCNVVLMRDGIIGIGNGV